MSCPTRRFTTIGRSTRSTKRTGGCTAAERRAAGPRYAAALVTIDATGTQVEIAKTITDAGGDYLAALKANWPALLADVETFFADPDNRADCQTFDTVDADHSRLKQRHHRVCRRIDWLASDRRYPDERRFPKAAKPYEFGCKVSIATPVTRPKGGQFVLHAAALHGNPYDGHTLTPVVAAMEALTGVEVRRVHVDKGYRGHNHPNRFRVWISGRVRGVTATIRLEMKRRAAVEPVIGHVKAKHRMQRNYLKGRDGDRANAVLAAAGYNFGLLLRWFAAFLRALITALFDRADVPQTA